MLRNLPTLTTTALLILSAIITTTIAAPTPSSSTSSSPTLTPAERLALVPQGCTSLPQCGCTSVAMSQPNWTVTDLLFGARFPVGERSYAFITFGVSNPAVGGGGTHCAASSVRADDFFYGEQWYACDEDEHEGGGGGATAVFRYDRPAGRLDINQTWVCEDQGYPANFRVSGGIKMELRCNDTAAAGAPAPALELELEARQSGEVDYKRTISCDEVETKVPWVEVDAWA